MMEFFNLTRIEAVYTAQLPSLPERVQWLISSEVVVSNMDGRPFDNKKKFPKR